ncbi:MAG: hypothetical protein ACRDK3_03490 [Actinomycetota bacterium]
MRVLTEHGVRYVVIGGMAGISHGSNLITIDLDICHDRSLENLERLASALQAMGARLRGVDEDVSFLLDARSLRAGDSFTFTTDAGDLDCLGTPSGTEGYEDLARSSNEVDLDGVVVRITSLNDLMRMKRAAGRPQDRIALEILGALRDEIERRDTEP